MSISFNEDTSTQLTYSSFPYTITTNDNYCTSNYANTLSTNNSNYTAAASNLLKSLIDTTNTNLSTNYYTKLSTDTLLNTKEAILSFTAPLTRNTNTIGINLGSYYTSTQTDTLLNAKQPTLTAATTLLGTGGSITGINYNTVINKPTFTSPLSSNATTNNISIDLTAYSTTATNNTTYLKLTGGTLTGALTVPNITLGSDGKINSYDDYHYIQISQPTNTLTIQEFGTISFNIGTTKTQKAYINSSGLTATAFYGDGANITNVPYSTITGKPTYFAIDPAIYYTQTQINTNILTAQTNNSNYSLNIFNILTTRDAINLATAQTNNSNYSLNISNVLLVNYNSLNTTTNTNSSNYASNISNVIIRNSSNYASNISNVLLTNSDATYLKLDGTTKMTGGLNFNNLSLNKMISFYDAATPNNFQFVGLGAGSGLILTVFGTGDSFKFQVGTSTTTSKQVMAIDGGGSISCAGNITMGTDNLYPDIRLGSTNGNNLGIATTANAFSDSAGINDMVIRSINKLILQSGGSDGGIIINNNNYTSLRKILKFHGGSSSDDIAVMNDLIFNQGAIVGGVWAGDTFITSFWGVSILLNSGGIANGNGGGDAGRAYDYGLSSFTVNMRTSTSSTTFDRRLFTIRPNGVMILYSDVWHITNDNVNRFYFAPNSISYYRCGANDAIGHAFMNSAGTNVFYILNNGNVGIGTANPTAKLHIEHSSTSISSSESGIYVFNPNNALNNSSIITTRIGGSLANKAMYSLDVNGNYGWSMYINGNDTTNKLLRFNNGWNGTGTDRLTIASDGTTTISGNLVVNNITLSGNSKKINIADDYHYIELSQATDTITIQEYGTIKFNIGPSKITKTYVNSTGLTCVGTLTIDGAMNMKTDLWHNSSDAQNRFYFAGNGATYYRGFGQYIADVNHYWLNHQGATKMRLSQPGDLYLEGTIVPTLLSVSSTSTDYCGIQIDTVQGSSYQYPLMVLRNTFTGLHRCFIDNEELFDINDIQKFKDDYVGRIVIATGKIATDTSDNKGNWEIKYDKEGLTIEDAVPMIKLSRTKKDKRVFGVLGDPKRSNSREERMIVNGVGEGAIWIINSNGNIFNGDLITTSDYLGYGELQNDDLIHNYTCGKITMDCSFELDSPLYNCYEIDDLDADGNKLRVAFVACVYYCS